MGFVLGIEYSTFRWGILLDIIINPDGTIEGLATEETRIFLSKLGEISEFGDSTVTLLVKHEDYLIYEVHDEHGHECSLCKKLTHDFILTKTLDSEKIMCKNCQPIAL